MRKKNWFDIDRSGLAQLLTRKGKEFAIYELFQNAWDEPGVSHVTATLTPDSRSHALLIVRDDAPKGFQNLSHAYTIFANSSKKMNPEQRGRFNLGEKLVLAMAREAYISTTTGTVHFTAKGRCIKPRKKRTHGSEIQVLLPFNAFDVDAIVKTCRRLIPPTNVLTTLNTLPLTSPLKLKEFTATLPTEIADSTGHLQRVLRNTKVEVYLANAEHPASIYEMGLPVCEIDGNYSFNVMQKIPLTLDREEVPGTFRKVLFVNAFNALADTMSADDTVSNWATAALATAGASPTAVNAYMNKRFGAKRVSYDPSDPEANKLAVSKGYVVVHGSSLSAGAWRNARQAEAIKPAGQVTPSPKVWTGQDNPDALPFDAWIPEENWTRGMVEIARFARHMAQHTIKQSICVKFCATAHHLGAASFGPHCELIFNKFRLGSEWFEQGITEDVVKLLIHEFGHYYSGDHLSAEYHEALCLIGARLWSIDVP